MIQIRKILGLALAASTVASAALLQYKERVGKYIIDTTWEAPLKLHWNDWKTQFGNNGLIKATDPELKSSNVSEAQSYAMLMSVWFNDQNFFKTTWGVTKSQFWKSNHFAWIISPTQDNNFAGDADQDILGALIFASALQDSGFWSMTTPSYKEEAITVLKGMQDYGKIVNSGTNTIASWPDAGSGTLNPSYAEVHWYQVFKEFGKTNNLTSINWDGVRTASYALINAQPSASSGMARNWSSPSGGSAGLAKRSSPDNDNMGFDAIRVPWRIGLDNMWYHRAEAGKWCDQVWNAGVVSPATSGMYTISGPTLWGWTDFQYEKSLSQAMWGTCAVSVRDSSAKSLNAANTIKANLTTKLKSLEYFSSGDTASKHNYYAQSLAIMGALAICGRAWNVWDDLKNPWVDTNAAVTSVLTATPSTVSFGAATVLKATFSHAVTWTLTFSASSGATYVIGPTKSASINETWTGTSANRLKPFKSGDVVTVQITAQWAAPPAGTSTSITLTPGTGISGRVSQGKALSWTSEGLFIEAGLVGEGQSVDVRVLDIAGHQLSETKSASVRSSNTGMLVNVAPTRMNRAGIVELLTPSGDKVRMLVPPIR